MPHVTTSAFRIGKYYEFDAEFDLRRHIHELDVVDVAMARVSQGVMR